MPDPFPQVRGLSINWNMIDRASYLREIDALSGLDSLDFHVPVTFFVGENGSGKSTLLEAIAVAAGFNPEGGTKNYRFSTRDSHSELGGALRLIRGTAGTRWGYFLRAESFYNVATAEEEYARLGGTPHHYHSRSHGESFLAIAQDNFKGGGLYLLDEPEAALSPRRQLTLMLEIVRCAKENAQFIIVTHSPILLAIPEAEILSFDDGSIHTVDYEDTDSFIVTEMFIRDRKRVLKHLLEDE
ncbi:MAG: AAA family ATPase [Clostridia bacterium]|nr:AAA family ATPase [Clostridia bacterium]